MIKNYLKVLSILVVIFGLIAFTNINYVLAEEFNWGNIGKITKLEGQVALELPGPDTTYNKTDDYYNIVWAKAGQNAKTGDLVCERSVFKTGDNSKLEILMMPQVEDANKYTGVITLGSNTEIEIGKNYGKKDFIKIISGTLDVKINGACLNEFNNLSFSYGDNNLYIEPISEKYSLESNFFTTEYPDTDQYMLNCQFQIKDDQVIGKDIDLLYQARSMLSHKFESYDVVNVGELIGKLSKEDRDGIIERYYLKSEENQVKEALFITVNQGQVKVSTGGMGMGFQEIVKKRQVEIY